MNTPTLRLLRPQTPQEVLRGLRCLMGGPEQGSTIGGGSRDDKIETHVAAFLEYAQTMGIETSRQVLALDPPSEEPLDLPAGVAVSTRAIGMCLWVASTGKSAMLFSPSVTDWPASTEATITCIREALADAQRAGVILVQAMIDPHDAAGSAMFVQAGLAKLATLIYMERRVPLLAPSVNLPAGLRLEPYNATTHHAFQQAILGSYEDTLDCPALSGMRTIDDVMAGHQAVGGGTFDPTLWHVVMEGPQPVGCLLLAQIPSRRAMEVAYLGLTPAGRGRGIGRALVQHTLLVAHQRGCALSTLAVDEANTPALKLYRRFGYSSVSRKTAMIKQLN